MFHRLLYVNNIHRWNSLNTYLVYTAESRALAMLEVSVYLDLSEDLPTDRFHVEIDIPDDVTILEQNTKDRPLDWDAKPPTLATQYIGDDFVYDAQAAVLRVPSSIVPQEFNYLINPNQPDTSRITVVYTITQSFNSRFRSSKS